MILELSESNVDGLIEITFEVNALNRSSPFSDEATSFLEELSRRLFSGAKESEFRTDLTALASWLRQANLRRMARMFARVEDAERGVRVPRGISFHVAPSNVEALFAYSWAISVMAGSTSVVRVSRKRGGLTSEIIDAIEETREGFNTPRTWSFVTYDHELPAVSERLVSAADVLVLWGGDASVRQLRSLQSKPDCVVVPFPDRGSLMVVKSAEYLGLQGKQRGELVSRTLRDVLSFGQAACSSPRRLVWVGHDLENKAAELDFEMRLAKDRGNALPLTAAESIRRQVFLFELAASSANQISVDQTRDLFFVKSQEMPERVSDHPGLGLLVSLRCDSLENLEALLLPDDQTLVQFGFTEDELSAWLRKVGNRAPRAVSSVGNALTFDYRWDGFNLLTEMTRLVSFKN